MAVVTMEQVSALITEAVKRETAGMKNDIMVLQAENKNLSEKITKLEWALDEAEQYNRKTSLILGGEGVPEGRHDESPAETRDTALKLIKENTIPGSFLTCELEHCPA